MICFNAPLTDSGFYSFDSDLGPLSLFLVFPPPWWVLCSMEFARVSKTNTCAEHSSKCVLLGGRGERSALSLSPL
jgi:hypothetical protein